MPPLCTSAVLALGLLMSDGEAEEDALVRSAMQQIAVTMEIMDPREQRYIMTRPEDFSADLKLLRNRYRNLADAPPAVDALRFPERGTTNNLLSFNRSYRHHLTERQRLYRINPDEIVEAIEECDALYKIWDLVRNCRCDYYYVTVRRTALKNLRELIGADAYYSGCLPPYIPICRFNIIN